MASRLGLALLGLLACASCCAASCPFYHFQVGEFNATVVSDGTTQWDTSTIFPDTPFEAVEQAYRANFMPTDMAKFYYNALYVDTGDKKLLFDCGSGVYFGSALGKLLDNMKAAGLDPAAVDAVLLSHGHVDHLGGLVTPEGVRNFPNAKYYISRTEQEYWRDATLDDLSSDFTPDLKQLLLDVGKGTLESVADKLMLFELGDEVMPGVTSRGATGHTPGHSAYIIKSGNDSLVFAGDTLVWDLFSVERPEWRMAFDTDKDTAIRTRLSLLGELADSRMRFLSYHNDFPGLGNIARSIHGFSFRPSRY